MTKAEWQAIFEAKELLHLGDKATPGEMKRAFRKLCKQCHPDLAGDDGEKKKKNDVAMQKLTKAYDLLMRYCAQYRVPLVPDDAENMDPEDWWMDRFGCDPLWGGDNGG
ncbi:MAG: J domain-containing protein [Thermodesulfobacteriota bacterium]